MSHFAIIVHGGAGDIPDDMTAAYQEACRWAVETGYEWLREGRSALDAVEAAVRILEDHPATHAGTGAALNRDGDIQLDAGIMDGSNLKIGAVAAVQRIANPVYLARQVMERTPHILLAGDGALQFARQIHFPECEPAHLTTERRYHEWKQMHETGNLSAELRRYLGDTVGAVARDTAGNIAVANSTCGISYKLPGRVGDTPLPGSGFYADNRVGGVACTGWGEAIIRTALAKTTLDLLRDYQPAEATQRAIYTLQTQVGGLGGLILIDAAGHICYDFNTPRMAFAYQSASMTAPVIGIDPADKIDYQPRYRRGVGAILLNDAGQVLICQRRHNSGEWQFPQGGMELGETPLDTFRREVWEETGTAKVQPLFQLPLETRYLWPPEKRAQEFHDGQVHTWIVGRFEGTDADFHPTEEFTAFRWVDLDQITTHTAVYRRDVYRQLIDHLRMVREGFC